MSSCGRDLRGGTDVKSFDMRDLRPTCQWSRIDDGQGALARANHGKLLQFVERGGIQIQIKRNLVDLCGIVVHMT